MGLIVPIGDRISCHILFDNGLKFEIKFPKAKPLHYQKRRRFETMEFDFDFKADLP